MGDPKNLNHVIYFRKNLPYVEFNKKIEEGKITSQNFFWTKKRFKN